MSVAVIRGDAAKLPLPDASVDLIVTSPPYFGLRSYTDNGEHYPGQVGAEPTPREYVDALIACTREWMRVLKPTGSIWVNLGDKYSGAGRGNNTSDRLTNPASTRAARLNASNRRQHLGLETAPAKSLIGLPWRYALRCIDELGLILRAEVIWAKTNGLPESVVDRVRRSHEQWFHLVKQPRYYSGIDHIREKYGRFRPGGVANGSAKIPAARLSVGVDYGGERPDQNPLGKLPGSVWSIATQPLKVPPELGIEHFAAFPMEWPRRIILGWSPSGICTGCGQGRQPVVEVEHERGWTRATNSSRERSGSANPGESVGQVVTNRRLSTIVGERCACPQPTAPTDGAVVLDPFGGTGTTALVADALGRQGLSVDMSADYCRLAAWRTADPAQRRRVGRSPAVAKPAAGAPGRGWTDVPLFDLA